MNNTRVTQPHTCQQCGSTFYPFRASKGLFCSNACKFKAAEINRTFTCAGCGTAFTNKKHKPKYCSHDCYSASKSERPALERLEPFIEKSDYCWLWTGGLNKNGYGRLYFRGKFWIASRLMYQIANPDEDITDKLVRHYICDNPPCVNPDHLRSGSHADNSQDMVNHKRHAHGETSYAKLKAADIPVIRSDPRSSEEIAKEYGVSRRAISAVRGRRSWKHIE